LSDYFGKPIVLNFWASWCPPCKAEMPNFESAYQTYGNDVNFLMVDLVDGQRETVKSGQDYVDEQNYSFPIVFDTDSDAAITYRIASIPTSYFIDSDGYIVSYHTGMLDKKALIREIENILK